MSDDLTRRAAVEWRAERNAANRRARTARAPRRDGDGGGRPKPADVLINLA